ncbi:MAG: 7-cyano-7-deazaguanine synthase QueC [bacterium]
MNKSIVLLSGGLDSVVSLAFAKEEYNVQLAITFDYGQRAKTQEITAAAKIAEYYGIEHKVIDVEWLAQITKTSLVNTNNDLPNPETEDLDDFNASTQTAKKVWVPNRNGLFLNIAASFADSFGYTHIIFGANREEAVTFSDNSAEFIEKINKSLEFSTLVNPKVFAPLIDKDKEEIVKVGLDLKVPLAFIRSCYTDNEKHCGKCESCMRLKRALIKLSNENLIKNLFQG